ncbi:dihydrofolate reductase family protein [Conyzicola lurida]|uniref:dihydrofolate reductase family protein n=1 Tax=Conyzicola lurida TaxID=1172621 RepID=UPI0016204FF9|nr:dihydrofolate reductase family protein [Conyzicola lurida]
MIVHQFVSADGFAGDESGEFALFDDTSPNATFQLDQETLERLKGVDTILLGANTYRMFAAFWPTTDSDPEVLAPRINELPKIVVSSTLEEAPWGEFEPALVLADGAADAVRRLKADLAGDIIVWGSLTLTDTLFREGLVDVVRLVIVPRVLGRGRGVFPDGYTDAGLTLVRTGSYDAGLVDIEYRTDRKASI